MLHTLHKTESLKGDVLVPIKTALQQRFSACDGWKMYNKYNWSNKCYDLILQNDSQERTKRVVVMVNLDKVVSKRHYDSIESLTSRLNQGSANVLKKILIVDNPSSFEAAPEDIELISISDLLRENLRATEPKLVA
ncbi:MAG: hypothetical protein R2794_06065 [Chitinophagales bacterium]